MAHLVQERNAVTPARALEPGPLGPESITLTIGPLATPQENKYCRPDLFGPNIQADLIPPNGYQDY